MSHYFRSVPEFDYVSRTTDRNISEYITVKNFFKRAKLREDILENLAYFTKYNITGDDRPDNIANEIYGDSKLDWLVLLSNNIMNVQTEWPMTQKTFDNFLLTKYGTNDKVGQVHHYETIKVNDNRGNQIIPAGLEVPEDYTVEYFDGATLRVVGSTKAITNYEYEVELENKKRQIYVLKKEFVSLVLNDLEEIMPYKKGFTQYVSETLQRGDNIRLYD
jgi:hypothetical protein